MKIEVEIPDTIEDIFGQGWEPTGEIRPAQPGERYAYQNHTGWSVMQVEWASSVEHLILRRKRWRADVGEPYYALDEFAYIHCHIENGSSLADARYEAGNYYRTYEEADDARSRVLAAYKAEEDDR